MLIHVQLDLYGSKNHAIIDSRLHNLSSAALHLYVIYQYI